MGECNPSQEQNQEKNHQMTTEMKTQIKSLVNGRANVVRDEENEKYLDMDDIAGTNSAIRDEIASKVMEENPDGMDVEVKGVRLRLGRHASCSGKTVWYNAEITREQYIAIVGQDFPDRRMQWSAYLDIDMGMVPRVTRFSRRNDRAAWKQKQDIVLDEAFVTIL